MREPPFLHVFHILAFFSAFKRVDENGIVDKKEVSLSFDSFSFVVSSTIIVASPRIKLIFGCDV